MDKSWINEDRTSLKYQLGLESFFTFVKTHSGNAKKLRCPCSKCVNFKKKRLDVIRLHCYKFGFCLSYTNWRWHGEPNISTGDGKPTDYNRPQNPQFYDENVDMCGAAFNGGDYDEESAEFANFVDDAQKPLFEGSEHTKLDALVKLHSLKAKFGLSDTCFDEVLDTISSLLPNGNVLPQTLYESRKTMNKLGLEYEKIHACPNDCILYRNKYAE